jgi:hypothetical protein
MMMFRFASFFFLCFTTFACGDEFKPSPSGDASTEDAADASTDASNDAADSEDVSTPRDSGIIVLP